VAAQEAGPPPRAKGPKVFLDYDQAELDAAYNQAAYSSNMVQPQQRHAVSSELARARLGPPIRAAYRPSEIEKLDVYRTKIPKAPVQIFIHGGAWRTSLAKDAAYLAEAFVAAGAHYVVPDFVWVQDAGGNSDGVGGSGSPRNSLGVQERRNFWRRS